MNQKDDLVTLLRVAMSLEALTIPPYLTAYWSIKDSPTTNDNQEAKRIIHSVAMEEMLHMMSVGNIIASMGYCPLFYNKCNTLEKWGEENLPILGFSVKLAPLSIEQIKLFQKIEKPIKPIDLKTRPVLKSSKSVDFDINLLALKLLEILKLDVLFSVMNLPVLSNEIQKILDKVNGINNEEFKKLYDEYCMKIQLNELESISDAVLELILFVIKLIPVDAQNIVVSNELRVKLNKCTSIGEFYALIIEELEQLDDSDFQKSFFSQLDLSHDPRVGTIEQRTIPSFIVDSKDKAVKLLKWVVDQGEGSDVPMDSDGELAHYYRFKQITKGYYIDKDDNDGYYFNYNRTFQIDDEEMYIRHIDDEKVKIRDEDDSEIKKKKEYEIEIRKRLSDNFNKGYFKMFKELQLFYMTGNRKYIMQSFDYMMKMSTNAEILMDRGAYPDFKFQN